MSFLDEAFDVIKGGVDAGVDAVDNVLPDIKNFLQRFEELGDPSKGPSILDKFGFMHDNPLVKLAGSPILGGAQLVINGMKLTTGWGEPENGEQFGTSATEMWGAGMILVYADPVSDEWDGAASETYAGSNSEHRHQTFEVSYADKEMQSILSDEATQVANARKTLTSYSDFLADFDTATSWMSAVPGGAAAKAALDTTVAAANVAAAQATMGKLMWDVSDNASKIHAAIRRYQGAADEEMLDSGSCTPFGEEHRDGHRLPTRTQTNQYTPPTQGPPVVYPPATPYESPTPAPPTASSPGTSAPTPTPASPAPSAPAPAGSMPAAPAPSAPAPTGSMPAAPAASAPAPAAPAPAASAAAAQSSAAPAVARASSSAQPGAAINQWAQSGSSDNRRAPIASAVDTDSAQSPALPNVTTARH